MNLIVTILEQGLIYGILSLGLYITYKILDFPDLTVDGSFPLGAAVTAALITRGVNPYLTLPVAFAAGVLAGICTGPVSYTHLLPAAWEDLKKIEDWYLINFDVETAIKVSDHILDGIERLGDFPDSGSRASDDWLNEQGYRMVISGKHVSIYRVIKDTVYRCV